MMMMLMLIVLTENILDRHTHITKDFQLALCLCWFSQSCCCSHLPLSEMSRHKSLHFNWFNLPFVMRTLCSGVMQGTRPTESTSVSSESSSRQQSDGSKEPVAGYNVQ